MLNLQAFASDVMLVPLTIFCRYPIIDMIPEMYQLVFGLVSSKNRGGVKETQRSMTLVTKTL